MMRVQCPVPPLAQRLQEEGPVRHTKDASAVSGAITDNVHGSQAAMETTEVSVVAVEKQQRRLR